MSTRKVECILLGALLVVFACAAVAVAAPVKITYLSHATAAEGEKDLLPLFHEVHPEIEVEHLPLTSLAAIKEKMTTMIAAGIAPDVVFGWETADWASQGILLNLDRFIAGSQSVNPADFIPGVWEYHRYQGSSYGIPYVFWSPLFFYNKGIFDTAGVSEPSIDWNWDELALLARRMNSDRDGDGLIDRWGLRLPSAGYDFGAFLATNGGSFFDFAERRVAFNDATGVETIEFLVSLVNEGIASHRQGQYANHQVGMQVEGPWSLASFREAGIDSGLRAFPAGRCCNRSLAGGEGLWILPSADPEREAAAWRLVEFLTETEQQVKLAVGSGYLPARLSAYRHADYAEVITQEPLIQDFADIAQETSIAYPDWVGAETALRQILSRWYLEALDGNISPTAALEQAEREILGMYGDIDIPWK